MNHMICETTDDGYQIKISSSFNNYEILKFLNKGKYSAVFLVEDKNSHEKYAAKIISQRYLQRNEETELILNEIKILRSINHPNIIKFYEAFDFTNDTGENFLIIICEYCENGDLLDFLISHDFQNEKEKRDIIKGIIRAIQYLHNNGISHGDIKPENVLLDKNMKPKLCDFGFAKFNNSFTSKSIGFRGTLTYSSPEIINGQNINSFKSDIWAFGITLYVISEKRFPFDAQNQSYSLYQIKHGYLYINPNEKIQYIVAKCTKMNPDERPSINEIFNDDYFNY